MWTETAKYCWYTLTAALFLSWNVSNVYVVYMQAVADSIPQLVQGMRSSQAQPEELGAQLALIMASQSFLQVRQSKSQHWYDTFLVVRLKPMSSFLNRLSFSLEVRWWHLPSRQFRLWPTRLLPCNWASVRRTWLPAWRSSGPPPRRYLIYNTGRDSKAHLTDAEVVLSLVKYYCTAEFRPHPAAAETTIMMGSW